MIDEVEQMTDEEVKAFVKATIENFYLKVNLAEIYLAVLDSSHMPEVQEEANNMLKSIKNYEIKMPALERLRISQEFLSKVETLKQYCSTHGANNR